MGRPRDAARVRWAKKLTLSDHQRDTMPRALIEQLDQCKSAVARRILVGKTVKYKRPRPAKVRLW